MAQPAKQIVAEAALDYVQVGDVIGVGTGSTVDYFIAALARIKSKIDGAVASSNATAARLQAHGITVLPLNQVITLPLYVDGADEATRHLHLIKGGGGALTREKIVAAASEKFVCIAEPHKLVARLGTYPLPVEVLPMAQSWVARALVKLGGQPQLRAGVTTDNGHCILDVANLTIDNPRHLESEINQLPGVVCNGLFARRGADILLLAGPQGLEKYPQK